MPFKPIGHGKFKSPSGRTFNKKQVALYYANGGKFPTKKTHPTGKNTHKKDMKH